MWPFNKPPVITIKEEEAPPVQTVIVRPAEFNPSQEIQMSFAKYRADAIARCIEQREAEGMPKHPEHDALIAEAFSYGWSLVKAKLWTADDIVNLEHRLGV